MARRLITLTILILTLLVYACPGALAYYPPLQDVQAWVESQFTGGHWEYNVRYKVYDPQRGTWRERSGGWRELNASPDLRSGSGVVAWSEGRQPSQGATWEYKVYYSTYDPSLGQWIDGNGGDWHTLNAFPWLTNSDGVVAWSEGRQPSQGATWEYKVYYSTYDPSLGQWIDGNGGGWRTLNAVPAPTNQDGVVAWSEGYQPTLGGDWDWDVQYTVHDPAPGEGWHRGSWGPTHQSPGEVTISNATVNWSAGGTNYTRGYDQSTGSWYSGPTKPFAYFAAQPTQGAPPLWVWLTDMSIGATSWNWAFGDSGSGSSRSGWHTYNGYGRYTLTQSISGPAGTHSATREIVTDWTPPTGSVTINGGDPYTASQYVRLTLSATDNSGTVSQMRFSSNGATWGDWVGYGTSWDWTLTTGDGERTVHTQFKDPTGNASDSYSDTIILDSTPPTGSIVINNGAESTSSTAVTLTLSASDATSGVAGMRLSNDAVNWTEWEPVVSSKPWTLPSGEGFNSVYAGFKDNAGNVALFSDTIRLDTTNPQVSMTYPASGDTNVAVTGTVTAVFSERMAPATFTTTTFTLRDGGGNPVSGSVRASDFSATFTPSASLAYGTTYTATITTGARDIAGNPLASDYVWSFTTFGSPSARLHVKTTGSDSNDGTTWTKAKRTVMGAVNAASNGTEIWVAEGTYVQPGGTVVKPGVLLYGGFPAAGGDWSTRDPAANETILDGNHAVTVVTIPENAPATTAVDGFTIRNGSAANGAGIKCLAGSQASLSSNMVTANTASANGGGIYCDGCSSRVFRNVISGNLASDGGGIYCTNQCLATVSANTISQNSATDGGGVCTLNSSPRVVGNTITLNTASDPVSGNGGGLICGYAPAYVSGNVISDNSASGAGGGVYWFQCIVHLENNQVAGNRAASGGGLSIVQCPSGLVVGNRVSDNAVTGRAGGVYCLGSSPVIDGNSVCGNQAGDHGGGVHVQLQCTPTLARNLIANNVSAGNGGGVSFEAASGGLVTQNALLGNSASNLGGGFYCLSPALDVTANLVAGNTAGGAGGGVLLFASETVSLTGNLVCSNTAGRGGGVCCTDCSGGSLSRNTISGNSAQGNLWADGGGVSCDNSSISISGNAIAANGARGQYSNGGGIWIWSEGSREVTVSENLIAENTAVSQGGGLYLRQNGCLTRNTVSRNAAPQGGGLYACDCSPTISANVFAQNRACWGGGALLAQCGARFTENELTGNEGNGGGIGATGSPAPTIARNLIAGNTSFGGGGGILTNDSPALVVQNTLVENTSVPGNWGHLGGGIANMYTRTSPIVSSNVIAFCSSGVFDHLGGTIWLQNNCVFGNTAYDYSGCQPGYQDVQVDPLLANEEAGDYRLRPVSPCIDTGDEFAEFDPDGTRADIGALPYFHLGAARAIADGQAVDLSGLVATVGSDDSIGSLCFQDVTNPAGIWAQRPGAGAFNRGGTFDVVGTMASDPVTGERYVANPTITPTTAETAPKPLFLINRSLGGGRSVLQPGVTGGSGLNNLGLLVRALGRVMEIDTANPATWFKIDDGSSLGVTVAVPSGVTIDSGWDYVRVTGISSCRMEGVELRRLIRVRAQDDIIPF